ELEWALERGARTIVMRTAAAFTRLGPFSPAHEIFDPFWARVNESGVTVVVHAGDSGLSANGYAPDGFSAAFGSGGLKLNIRLFSIERAAHDFLATLILERLFERFPNVRVASVENGSEFLSYLFRKLRHSADKTPGYFKHDPVDTFRRHVWINPFWEDDVQEVVDLMGADRVIFGSDWPHIEALPEPLDYLTELRKFDADTVQLIMRDNASELNELRPAT
ncbi:MAG TPA: amidohydrolase family protein, partial [Acidimicrobiales bacterium]|nr:amidohydrolase family protein [Acidimicrobiales bacterium]